MRALAAFPRSLLLGIFVCGAWPASARADDKAECSAAYEQVQSLRHEGKLVAARSRVLVCARDACRDFIKVDCGTWLGEIDASMPTMVFTAVDADGKDAIDVRVLIDEKETLARLDGTAVPVDPGIRKIRFEMAGAQAIDETIQVRAGEKNRRFAVSFVKSAPSPAEPIPPTHAEPQPDSGDVYGEPEPSSGGTPAWGWVAGGVGIASAGAGIGLLVASASAQSEITDHCGKGESGYDADSCAALGSANDTKQALAGVFTGVGVIGIGAAIVAMATAPPARSQARARPGVRTDAWIASTSAGASLKGDF